MKEKEKEKLSPDFDLPAQEADPVLSAQIRAAFTEMKPEADAKKRMYQNILKKAEAQGKVAAASDAPATEETQRPAPAEEFAEIEKQDAAPNLVPIRNKSSRIWRRYLSLAACLLLIITAGFSLPKWLTSGDGNLPGNNPGRDTELQDPPTLAASPYEDVEKPEDFARLGFAIDAPAEASNIAYCIAYGTTAQVDFTMAEHHYTYLAEKTTEDTADISGIYGEVQEHRTLTLANGTGEEIAVTLEKISTADSESPGVDSSADTPAADGSDNSAAAPDIWRASWQNAGVSYWLLNEDGAEESAMTAGVQALAAKM